MLIKRDPVKIFNKAMDKYQKEIPPQFNNCEILRSLGDADIDKCMSITTRGDGKTTNIFATLAKLSRDLDFESLIVVRHAELKNAMLSQLRDAYTIDENLDETQFGVNLNYDMISVTAYKKEAFIICDLNNAMDLKNYSARLKQCNLIVFDEFLTLPDDYESNEFAKFKVIFETMDRDYITPGQFYTNNRRKALFMGNPVDFSSEFLGYWDLYKELESQKMDTIVKYPKKHITIERRKNSNAQLNKNNRMFDIGENNESVTGEFTMNTWQLKEPIKSTPPITIKTSDKFINIFTGGSIPVLSVVAVMNEYQYNTDLIDNTTSSTYLKDKYYKPEFEKKYTKELFAFSNQFSKNYILKNYPSLNMFKVIREQIKTVQDADKTPQELERKQHEIILQKLAQQYFM